MCRVVLCLVLALLGGAASAVAQAPSMPATAGETLSGKRIVLSEALRGRAAILVAGFSHQGGVACSDWMKVIRKDPALAGIDVYEIAMLQGAPGLLRGMIKSGMRKGMSTAEQERSIVLTHDDKLWARYFEVTNAQEPQVILLDAAGNILWHGHGPASAVEPQLRTALKR